MVILDDQMVDDLGEDVRPALGDGQESKGLRVGGSVWMDSRLVG